MSQKVNLIVNLMSSFREDHYHTVLLGNIIGFLAYFGIEGYVLDKFISLVLACITAFFSGILLQVGKELVPFIKAKFKKWTK